MMIERKTS